MDEDRTFEETPAEETGAQAPPDEESVAEAEVVDPEATPPKRRRVRWRWVARATFWGLVVLVGLAIGFLSQTGRGQRIVLDEVLQRVRSSLAGDLTVDSLRSRALIFGMTLRGVRLDAEGGRRFLEADSVVMRYNPVSLAIGSPRFSSATFYGLDVEISRYPGDDFTNVNRLLPASEGDGQPPSAARTIGLGRIAVRGGSLEILTPAASDVPAELTVDAPDGGRLRRMAVENLDLDLERTIFRSEGPVMVDSRLASLSASIFVLEQPLVIHEAQADLTFGDRGLRIEDGQFRLPGSFLEGGVGFGPDRPGDDWIFTGSFRSDDWSSLADIRWVDPRIPTGRFRGDADLRVEDGIQITLGDVDVEAPGSVLALDGGVRFADVMSMRSLRVTASPLDLTLVEPWVEGELPFEGSLRGNATLGGTLADLSATGRMTFTPNDLPAAATTADFSGTLHAGDNPGGSSLQVRLDPFDYRVLEPVWADAARLGRGRAVFSIEGRADDGMLIVADVVHRSDSTTTSRAVGRGTLRRAAERDWVVDARAELSPLSLPLLGRLWPDVDLPGAVQGPVRVSGRLNDLKVEGDLTSDAGRLAFDVTTDMTAPAERYVVEADADALDLSAFTTTVPKPSVFTGHASIDGSGFTLDSLLGSAVVALSSARVGGLALDSTDAALEIEGGLLTATDVRANVAGILIEGSGSVGMTAERNGEARFTYSAETLEGLRPVFMGDSILVADTLNPLEQDALRARGIDPDTLPTAMDVRMEGGLEGTAEVRGWLRDLDVDLLFDLTRAAYGHNSVDSARVSLMASGLPATMGEWEVDLRARQLVLAEREFQQLYFDGTMVQRRGDGILDVVRRPNENYHLTGAFAVDSLGGELQLTEAQIEVDSMSWVLSHPMSMAWDQTTLTVDSLEVTRAGEDPMLVTAAGTLTRGGDSDFRLLMQGFHVEQALRLAQREDIDLAGHVDLDLDVTGPAEQPIISARFDVDEPRYGPVRLTRLDGTLEYRDEHADVDLAAWVDDRQVFTGDGMIPVDLALADVESRTVEEQMDLTLRADSLDAALALVYLSALEDVTGTISAEMRVRGTPVQPRPSGTVTLSDAAWTLPAIGVRHTNVSGDLLLQPNGTVGIKLSTNGGANQGSSTISGLVRLDPLTNPTLDLTVSFDRFLAVDRRDMEGRMSGDLTVTGRYQLPVIEGALRLEEATLYVEEFARNADVVDLRNPLLYAPGMAVDTTVFVSQPLIAGLSNPFLDNLRVDVDLAVPRNLWLRSPDMNVELGGDLIVRYDRRESDLVMVGELQALRGSYTVLGRTFEVSGGTASFLGQPGVNPTLDIQALSRVRRREGEPLEVNATVGGTLVEPVVTLSTEEAGISQSDLITYLLVGRSAAEVGPQADVIRGAAGTYLTGVAVNQLGTAIAQEIPLLNQLDYLSFSSSAAIGGDTQTGVLGNALGSAQVELGKYLNDRVFVVFVLGGKESDAESGASLQLRGVRTEFTLDDSFYLEAFMEERFLRTGSTLGASDLATDQILGLFLFGDWGFGSRQQD